MPWWEVVLTIVLLDGMEYKEKMEQPKFHDEQVCKAFIKLPQFRDSLIEKYWNGNGVAYILPKCKPNIGI